MPFRLFLPRGAESSRELGSLALIAILGSAAVLASGASPVHGMTPPDANYRWAGANGTLRIPLELKKRPDKDGWSATRYISVPGRYTMHPITRKVSCSSCAEGELPFAYYLRVSDRGALGGLLRGREIPAGTEFSVRGWRALGPDRGFILELEFRDAPVTARFYFAMTPKDLKEGMSWDRLEQIEQFMRVRIFQLAAADEQLVEAAESVPTPRAGVPSVEREANGRDIPSGDASIRILGVAVDPSRVAPGDEIRLIITYNVSGPPTGVSLNVVEQRTILAAGEILTTLTATFTRQAGTHESTQPLRIPDTLEPGIFEFQASLLNAGVAHEGSALFQVMRRDP